jgi:hypothetical protein
VLGGLDHNTHYCEHHEQIGAHISIKDSAGLGVVLLCFVIVPYICRLVLISVSKIAREKAPVRAIASEITTNTAHTDSKY